MIKISSLWQVSISRVRNKHEAMIRNPSLTLENITGPTANAKAVPKTSETLWPKLFLIRGQPLLIF